METSWLKSDLRFAYAFEQVESEELGLVVVEGNALAEVGAQNIRVECEN